MQEKVNNDIDFVMTDDTFSAIKRLGIATERI